MSKPKPICAIKYNQDRFYSGAGTLPDISNINDMFSDRFPDYLVFAYPEYSDNMDDELFQFQVFHEKDFTTIQYQELKALIEEALKNLKP